jgi:hypothetical protein
LLVRRVFKGIEAGAAEVDQTSSVPNSCPNIRQLWFRTRRSLAPCCGSTARVPPTPVVLGLYALPLSVVIPPRIPAPQRHGGFPEPRVAVCPHDQHPEVTPVYDEVGNLTGWRGSDPEVLTGIRTALDGGRREFKSTFDGPASCVESCRSSRVQVLSDKTSHDRKCQVLIFSPASD